MAKRLTAAEQVHKALAGLILSGDFRPGEKLDEISLAERFSVSRTPVREALRQLVASGLVEHRPNRGVIVSLPSDAQLAEMFELLAELEGACAKYAAMRMSPAEKINLERIHEWAGKEVRANHRDSYREANRAFHSAIYQGCHNANLIQTTEITHARCAPFRAAQFSVPDRLEASHAEHSRVIDAILVGDPTRAYAAMFAHVSVVRAASCGYVHGLEQAQGPTIPHADGLARHANRNELQTG